MSQSQTVFVGLSGGVDSSVAALRLIEKGFSVVGVFIKVWHPPFLECNWEQERLDAMRVAAHLNIPFLTCDAETAYRDAVASYFIESYKAGRTPNPDVMCNKEVKFGAFLKFALDHGADYIATGHYAQIQHINGQPALIRGVDRQKDQSYFLWTLTTTQLSTVLLPVGDTDKTSIRKEAAAAGMPTATKKDSQGVCFLGHVDIPDFLSHYVTLTPGTVLDQSGAVVGTHQGALVYTIGQRHGFTLQTHDTKRSAQYVIAKDIERNTITVSDTPPTIAPDTTLTLRQTVLRRQLTAGDIVEYQTRYRQAPLQATVAKCTTNSISLTTSGKSAAAASGQSCVLYNHTVCIGGGIIV